MLLFLNEFSSNNPSQDFFMVIVSLVYLCQFLLIYFLTKMFHKVEDMSHEEEEKAEKKKLEEEAKKKKE